MQQISDHSPTGTIIAQACAFKRMSVARTCASEPSLDSHIVFDVNVSEGARSVSIISAASIHRVANQNGG